MFCIKISRLDHFVLRVSNLDEACRFYSEVLGMEVQTFNSNRKSLHFGNQKINLHEGTENVIKASFPTLGSADLCFITEESLDDVILHLKRYGVAIEEGPVQRTGATGSILSVYIRDLDGNLIELSNYTNNETVN